MHLGFSVETGERGMRKTRHRTIAVRVLAGAAIIICALCIVGALMSVLPGGGELIPENNLPDREIVFRDVSQGYHQNRLGFIHSDGSGFTTRTLHIWNSQLQSILLRFTPLYELGIRTRGRYTWSPDGEYLVTQASLSSSRGPNVTHPILISSNGAFIICPRYDLPASSAFNRAWVVSGTQVVTVNDDISPSEAILIDMGTCEVSPLLVGGEPLREVDEVTISTSGWVAAVYGDGIQVYSSEGSLVVEIPNAHSPSWSRDGEWLAYVVREEGIYIIRNDGTDQRQLVEDARPLSPPSWSPEGDWIVYGCYGVIYKVNIETEEIVPIYEGNAVDPVWRWGLGDDGDE
jgi:hypothetical protein